MFVDVNGNEFESYEAACYYYGCDTPAQLEAEERYWAEQEQLASDWAALQGEPQPYPDYVPSDLEECPF